jgi:hypothetical protein
VAQHESKQKGEEPKQKNEYHCILVPVALDLGVLACVEPVTHGRKQKEDGRRRQTRRNGRELSLPASYGCFAPLKDAGVPDAVVMALVGPESAAMSHRYTHVGKDALAKAAKTLPEL